MGLDEVAFAVVIKRMIPLEFGDMGQPRRKILLETLAGGKQVLQAAARIGHVGPRDLLDFSDLGRVDVQVCNVDGIGGKLGNVAGDTIVEARAYRDQKIAILHGVVGVCRPMHAKQVKGERMGGIEGSDRLKRRDDGNLERRREAPQLPRCLALDDASTRIQERPIALAKYVKKRSRSVLRHTRAVELPHAFTVAAQLEQAFATKRSLPILYVFRYVEDHRPRPIATRDIESRSHGCFKLFRFQDEKCTLCACTHDVENGRFLECIGADRVPRYLSTNKNDWNRVRHRISNRRDAVSRARS